MVRFSMRSDKGMRVNNEDSVGMYQNGDSYCFILADGLGGHGKGEVASQLAVQAVIEEFVNTELNNTFMDRAFLNAQKAVVEGQKEDRTAADMKTTMVVLKIGEKVIQWGHIGDSRLYCFLNGHFKVRTLDHSVPQMLVAIGELKEKQIRNHPDRSRVLRVLGVEEDELKYQLSDEMPCEDKMAFLLCSDGFWELIEEKKMESLLKRSESPSEWLEFMESVILKSGKGTNMDNYSAIAVWNY